MVLSRTHVDQIAPKDHARKTLQKLAGLLPSDSQTKPQIIVLAGSVTPYRNDTDRELAFRQVSPSITSDPVITLFIPDAHPADLMWTVPPPTIPEARETYNVSNVLHTESFPSSFVSALNAAPDALVHTLPQISQFPALPPTLFADASHSSSSSDAYLLSALHRARLTKSDAEVQRVRRANEISSRAHEVVMRVLGAGVRTASLPAAVSRDDDMSPRHHSLLPGEWLIEREAEAEAIFVASCRREGAVHQAYLPIVAASTRAATLHYCCNDREFAWGPLAAHDRANRVEFAQASPGSRQLLPQVLLIDAGCEWDNYASDITRTMPVGNGGKFTPKARAIYELVLEMQTASFKVLKPELHWDAVQLLCHRVLVRGFQKLGIFRAETEEAAILASGISAAFFPHGVGHSLGLDVHDVPSASKPVPNPRLSAKFYEYLRLRLPLKVGMVVTVEPGIYFHQHLLTGVRNSRFIDQEVLSQYEPVGGVRIEDVVLITPNGAENLTKVRSDVEWIEGVCSGNL
ncbi:Creatinase/aminopeptidase [Russula aff. rugulosa BPL654]|nr:Creatinase/aminopeptidase [Russula aff. rugulosa BPL654]